MPLRPQNGINATGQRVQNVADPTAAQDAATKAYVDARAYNGIAVLAADVTNSTTTIADVTGLSFPVVAGRYFFRALVTYTAAAATTGSRWAINGPTATTIAVRSEWSLTTATRTTNDAVVAYDSPTGANASSAGTAGNVAVLEGVVQVSAAGTVVVRFASEIAASAIVAKAGSILEWLKVG